MDKQQLNILPDDYRFLQFFPFAELDNWSAYAILGNNIGFSNAYNLVKLKSFLKRNKTPVTIVDEQKYRRVKVKLYGNGVQVRDDVFGSEIKTKKQWLLSKGQFIISKIDARNGAFGIAIDAVDGAIVTNDFPVYDVDGEQIITEFLYLITITNEFQKFCQSLSSGTTGRQRIDEEAFLNISIPLPTKAQQKIIVDDFKKNISDAENRNAKSEQLEINIASNILNDLGVKISKQKFKIGLHLIEFKELSVWSVEKLFNDSIFKSSKYTTTKLSENRKLYIDAFRGKSPKYDEKSKAVILNQKCNRWNEINLDFVKKVNADWLMNIDDKFFTQENDVIINSTGEGTIGRSSLITKNFTGYLYDSHILLLRLNKEIINPKFFVYQFNSQFVQDQINEIKSAQSTKQTELGIDNLMLINFVIPEIKIQREITDKIESIYKEITRLKISADEFKENAKSEFEQILFKK
jgi:type I restriction enzyme S subunit